MCQQNPGRNGELALDAGLAKRLAFRTTHVRKRIHARAAEFDAEFAAHRFWSSSLKQTQIETCIFAIFAFV